MTRRSKTIFWLAGVALFLVGAIVATVCGMRSLTLKMVSPSVLISRSPTMAGELHLMKSGLVDADIAMYVVRKGDPEIKVVERTLGSMGMLRVVWSADGTVCAVRLPMGDYDHNGYASAYDFSTERAYVMTWSPFGEVPKDKALLQHETIEKLLNARNGPVPNAAIINLTSFNHTPRLTWAEWQKYAAAREKSR